MQERKRPDDESMFSSLRRRFEEIAEEQNIPPATPEEIENSLEVAAEFFMDLFSGDPSAAELMRTFHTADTICQAEEIAKEGKRPNPPEPSSP